MTKVMIYNAVVLSVFFLCVTWAAIHFENALLLFWYFLGCVFLMTYKKTDGGEKDG